MVDVVMDLLQQRAEAAEAALVRELNAHVRVLAENNRLQDELFDVRQKAEREAHASDEQLRRAYDESVKCALRWEALARQLGDALERHARMASALLAQQVVRDAPETIAEVNRALSVYRDAIEET